MRHYYIRLFGGIVWLAAAAVNLFTGALPFVAIYGALGAAFLTSARKWRDKK